MVNHKEHIKKIIIRLKVSMVYRMIGTTTITGEAVDDVPKRRDKRNKGVVFKNCAPFIECTMGIANTQIYHANCLI